MSSITKPRRSSRLRPSRSQGRASGRNACRASKRLGNEGQVCGTGTPVQLAGPQPQPEAHEDPTCEAMDQYMDDGTEAAEQHAAASAAHSQLGQDNASAAASDVEEESIRAQPSTTSPLDGAGAGDASSVSGGFEARVAQDSRLASFQSIKDHRLMGESFDLQCMLATGQLVWFNEADVQEACSPAVCTYWNCTDGFERPKDVVPPEVFRVLNRCPQEPDSLQVQMVGDPIFSGTDFQKKRLFERKWIQDSTCKLIFNYKSVNLSKAVLGTRWPKQYHEWQRRPSVPECDVQFIHGHRKAKTESKAVFQFSILSKKPTKGTYESWVDERDLQLEHGAAVLTYWRSNPEQRAREAKKRPRVPDRPLRIHSHHRRRGVLYFKAHYVGKSACQEDLRSVSAATLKTEWEEGTKEYLGRHSFDV